MTEEVASAVVISSVAPPSTRSKVYDYPGYRWYGTTQAGKFATENDALAEGDRAALNERRPVAFYATPRP